MLYNDTRTSTSATATIAALDRSVRWTLVDELPLRFDAHHPQGMARIGAHWWVSTVDIAGRRGSVVVIDDRGDLVESIPVGDDLHHHPGGMDFDGDALWIATAEYRPDSTTTVFRLEPGSAPQRAFAVDDHVGAIARCGREGDLVGWSWGSRRFYRWSVGGELRSARVNPGFFVDHQDCQWLDTGHLLCGGVALVDLAEGPGWLGGMGLLDAATLEMQREIPFPIYPTTSRLVGTHNPIWSETTDSHLIVHLLPDDGAGTIVSYATPLAGVIT